MFKCCCSVFESLDTYTHRKRERERERKYNGLKERDVVNNCARCCAIQQRVGRYRVGTLDALQSTYNTHQTARALSTAACVCMTMCF